MDNKESTHKNVIKFIDTLEPDRELLLWEEWIKIRKEETSHLASVTNRPPADLTMNLLENVREDKERKTILEYAQIKKKPSLRGGLWEQPLRLKQACRCAPVYEVHRTAAEMGIPQVIEHIGVPKDIQQTEKGLAGQPERKPCDKMNADYVRYREKRELQLSKGIKKLDPFRPDISNLMVRGNKPKGPSKKLPPLPRFSYLDFNSETEVSSVYAVKINKTVLYKDIPDQSLPLLDNLKTEPSHEQCTSWTYYFNVPVRRAGRSKLYLENLGTVTLRYCWKKIKKNIPFIPEEAYNQTFFFNKNEDVLSPGQSKEIFFTFLSKQPGIFSESWELSFCNICFFDTLADKLVVHLNADAVEDLRSMLKRSNVLKSRIARKSINNMVSSILHEVVTKATSIEPLIYPYKELFLEAEMFVMKNPVCFYHQSEVLKMKDLYKEMTPERTWDLSIATWRESMMEKVYDDRVIYYGALKKSHVEFLKPWYEGETVLQQKYRAMKWLLIVLADKIDNEYERALNISGVRKPAMEIAEENIENSERHSLFDLEPQKVSTMRNLFYLYTYEHVVTTIEMCAGILSSIDLNRWVDFDFCRT